MKVAFTHEALREYNEILTRYPEREAAILPTLHLAQREFGYLSSEVVEYVSGLLGFTGSTPCRWLSAWGPAGQPP
jgi:NADH:ubiquinone oxidoreductase subunit E